MPDCAFSRHRRFGGKEEHDDPMIKWVGVYGTQRSFWSDVASELTESGERDIRHSVGRTGSPGKFIQFAEDVSCDEKIQGLCCIIKSLSPNILCAWALCLSSLIPYSFAKTDERNEVTLIIPARVMVQFINDVLPMEIAKGREFTGAIWVKSVDSLDFEIDKVSFCATIYGEDIKYTGKIGTLSTSLSLGAIETSLKCHASIRYDRQKRILYVRPRIVERGNRNKVLPRLLAELIDKEYPVEIKKLKPLVTRFGDKSVTIDMDISNVYAVHNRLLIGVRPRVKTENK